MAKIKSKLFNELRGKLKHVEFRVRKNGVIELSMKRIPAYTRTPAQDAIRTKYGQLVQEWKQLDEATKAQYEAIGRRYAISGWNAYVMQNLVVPTLQPITLEGFDYYRYINIPVTTPASEECQYYILINGDTIEVYNTQNQLKTSGTGGNDFWANVQNTGNDIRVFDQSQNLIYFFVESLDYNGQTAKIWVRLTTTATELNIAYGNSSATKSVFEDPTQVFEFFDDFEDQDFSDWTVYSGTWYITTDAYNSNYALTKQQNANNDIIAKTLNYDRTKYAIRIELYTKQTEAAGTLPFGFLMRDTSTDSGYIFRVGREGAASKIETWVNGAVGSTLASAGSGISDNVWYHIEIELYLDGTIKFRDGTGAEVVATDSTYMNFNEFALRFYRVVIADEIKAYKLADPATFGTPTTIIIQ